jgi:hypothetical protein
MNNNKNVTDLTEEKLLSTNTGTSYRKHGRIYKKDIKKRKDIRTPAVVYISR